MAAKTVTVGKKTHSNYKKLTRRTTVKKILYSIYNRYKAN